MTLFMTWMHCMVGLLKPKSDQKSHDSILCLNLQVKTEELGSLNKWVGSEREKQSCLYKASQQMQFV